MSNMDISEKNLNKLRRLLDLMDENALTKEEFTKSFKNVVELVLKVEKELTEKSSKAVSQIEKLFNELKVNLEGKANSELSRAISELKERADKVYREQVAGINLIGDKLKNIKDGKDGSQGKSGKDGKDGSPDKPEEIRNKLETLKGKERLEMDAIDGLLEALEELKKIRTERRVFGGGGFSKMAMDLRIIDPYIPTGTVNGVNTDFVLIKNPNPSGSLKVYRGGALQSLTEDYTLSGKTITFLVAPSVGEILKVEHRI